MTAPRRVSATRLAPDERRRQLLDVACVEFADRGFHATAMDDLALAAGVTKPVFYQHFLSKRALFIAVLEDVGGRLMEVLTEATASVDTGRDRVEQGFSAYFHFVEQCDAMGIRVPIDTAAAVSTLIEIHGSQEHSMVLAHALVGMAEGISRHALTDPDGPHQPDQLAGWVAELAWFGLRGVRNED